MFQIKKMKWAMVFGITFICLLASSALLKGDDDDEHEASENHREKSGREEKGGVTKIKGSSSIPVVTNLNWKTECSSCHMLYLPGLLPSKSWTSMMSGLNKHFGENAELDPKVQKEITDFLVSNSADKVHSRRGDKIIASIGQKGVKAEILRISETGYFLRKHDEIGPSVYKRKGIGSPANCTACHSGAEKGDFSERNIKIPKETPSKSK
jgi:hypothetical protein